MATRLQWQVDKNWIYFSLFSIKLEIAEISTQRSYKTKVTVESDKVFAAGRALSPADCQPWHVSVGSWAGRVGVRSALKFFVKTQRIPPLVILRNFLAPRGAQPCFWKPPEILVKLTIELAGVIYYTFFCSLLPSFALFYALLCSFALFRGVLHSSLLFFSLLHSFLLSCPRLGSIALLLAFLCSSALFYIPFALPRSPALFCALLCFSALICALLRPLAVNFTGFWIAAFLGPLFE